MEEKFRLFCLNKNSIALLFLVILMTTSVISNAWGQTIKPGDILPLNVAIEIALKNQPSIETQLGQLGVAEARAGQAWGDLYPKLSIGGSYSRISPVDTKTGSTTSNVNLPPDSSNIPTGSAGLYSQYAASGNASLTIFDFGKTWANIQSKRLSYQAARHDLQATRSQVIEGVRETYYSLLSAHKNKEVTGDKVQQFKKHVEYARGLYMVGAKSKLDVLKAEVDLSGAQVDMIKAENAVRLCKLSLNHAMGLPRAPAYNVEDDPSADPPAMTFETAMKTALSRREDLISLQKQMESAEQALKAAEREHFPVLSGGANYMFVGTESPLDRGWTAGLSLSIPIFKGFSTHYKVVEYRANLKVINGKIKDLKQSISLELEKGFLDLWESEERMKSGEVAVKQAKENLDLANERYRAGLAINVEVTDAIYTYANARYSYISAQYNRKIAYAKIEKAVGSPVAATAP